jgi:hypothetical protein
MEMKVETENSYSYNFMIYFLRTISSNTGFPNTVGLYTLVTPFFVTVKIHTHIHLLCVCSYFQLFL